METTHGGAPCLKHCRVVTRPSLRRSLSFTQKGHVMNSKPVLSLVLSSAVVAGWLSISGCGGGGGGIDANAQVPVFTLASPDLASGTFATQYILNGFGCTGGNTSPAVVWSNPPAGTKSFALQVFDPDAPTGSGFWHWGVYNIPPTATGVGRG